MSTKELPAIYLTVGPPTDEHAKGMRAILAVTYTASGAIMRRHYSGDIVGRASGGGYCRGGVCLAQALAKIHGIPETDGAWGERHVIEHAEAHGVRVYSLSDALWALAGVEAEVTA